MRRYNKGGQLETITCSCYGKRLVMQQGIIREGCISIDHAWDYFSKKDGQVHHFDLCEECYDELVFGLRTPVNREEQIEFLQDGMRRTAKTVLFNMYSRISYGECGEVLRRAVSVQHRNPSLDKECQVTCHFLGNVVA